MYESDKNNFATKASQMIYSALATSWILYVAFTT